jgi:hypothetical protein
LRSGFLYIGTATPEHFVRILDFERHNTLAQVELSVMYIAAQRHRDSVLIDRRNLVLIVDGSPENS